MNIKVKVITKKCILYLRLNHIRLLLPRGTSLTDKKIWNASNIVEYILLNFVALVKKYILQFQ